MEHQEYAAVPLPYPAIEPVPNLHYARILMEDYAGIAGELTAITTYGYQHVVVAESFPNFSEELSKISIVEMHHLHILAELIQKLGGDPLYRAHSNPTMGHFWSAQNVNYQHSFPDIIVENIKGEKLAIENYKRHLCLIQDASVQKNLCRIIQDEEHHIHLFSKALALWKQGALT